MSTVSQFVWLASKNEKSIAWKDLFLDDIQNNVLTIIIILICKVVLYDQCT